MKVLLFLALLFYIIFIVSSRYGGRNRRQALKCIESCVLLKECDPYLELLRTSGLTARRKIKENRCGREGLRIKVCCPKKPSIQTSYFPYECGFNPVVSEKVYYGNITKMGEFPWIAALEYKKPDRNTTIVKCSGSLINGRYVLTAAHCFDPEKLHGYKLHSIRLGDWDLSTQKDCFTGQEKEEICAPPFISISPEEIIPHPKYNNKSENSDDIALIRLNQTVDFDKAKGFIMPICLPSFGIQAEFLKRDRDPILIGWGETENAWPSSILLKADLPFAERKLCTKYYDMEFGEKQLCVGGGQRDSCQGDSGGPLMLAGPNGPPFLQIGFVSFGYNCGVPGIPTVYTSVSHYKPWISQQMKPWDE